MKKKIDIHKLVRSIVQDLQPYTSARDEYVSEGTQMIFLDANESPYENGVNRYPDPRQRNLKAVLAERKGVDTANILLGNGSDEVLDLLFRAFCEPREDNIITMPPTYGMYKVLANVNGIENREVLLTNDFQPDAERILEAVDSHTKIIFICSPNNPTGNSFSPDIILRLLENFHGLVVIDEAYIDFSSRETWVEKLPEFPNLVVTHTLSKAYGMAGIRLGICLASVDIIAILNKIKLPYNVNELTQQRALQRVMAEDVVEKEVREILRERDVLTAVMEKVPFVEKIYASDANFILAKVDDADKRYAQLLGKGIVVRNRSQQPLCDNALRFTVGLKAENKQLINALKSLV
ncbi:MAG TPA: histidinol-phosphate transaminase [Eudoraea sp.]|nr:histidinol-phosphate transaminase [Eudoraea sp.]